MTKSKSEGVLARHGAGSGILKNLFSSSATTAIAMMVGVWYTPFMLDHLPASAYGLIPLATSIAGYLSIVTVSVAGAVGRFVAADAAREDYDAANKTLNAFFFLGMLIAAALLGLAAVFVTFLPIAVPDGLHWQARLLFMGILASFVMAIPNSVFDVSVWITSRFEIRAASELTGLTVRLGTLIAMFYWLTPAIWQVGIAMFAGTWASLIVLSAAFHRLTPKLKIRWSSFDASRARAIASSTSWMILNQFANIVSLGFDMFLINRVLGTEANTKYSVVLVWISALRAAFSSFSLVLAPRMIVLESVGQTSELTKLSLLNARLQGSAIAAVAGTVCGLAPWLLAQWLRKPWTDEVVPVAWILLLALCVEACGMTFGPILNAEGRMRKVSLATASIGLTGAGLGWILLRSTSSGLVGISIAVATTSIVRHGVFASIFVADSLGASRLDYIKVWFKTLLKAAAFGGLAYGIGSWIRPETRPSVVVTAVAVGAAVLVVSYYLLHDDEKLVVKKLMRIA